MPSRDQAEQAARELLLQTWSEDLENCPLPIDSFYIAGRLGLDVAQVPLASDVSGMLLKDGPDADPIVFVNALDHLNRQRFSCAHELGHYDERRRSGTAESSWGYIDRRGPTSSQGVDPSEIHANQFAAALLMPADRVHAMKRRGMSVSKMALEFGVSEQAMSLRLDNLSRTW